MKSSDYPFKKHMIFLRCHCVFFFAVLQCWMNDRLTDWQHFGPRRGALSHVIIMMTMASMAVTNEQPTANGLSGRGAVQKATTMASPSQVSQLNHHRRFNQQPTGTTKESNSVFGIVFPARECKTAAQKELGIAAKNDERSRRRRWQEEGAPENGFQFHKTWTLFLGRLLRSSSSLAVSSHLINTELGRLWRKGRGLVFKKENRFRTK